MNQVGHISTPQRRLNSLYHLAVELSAQRDLNAVFSTALQHSLQLTDSQFGFVGLVNDEDAMDVVATRGFHPAADFYEHNHLIPLHENIFMQVMTKNRPIRSADMYRDPRRVGQPHGHPPVFTFLGVPLRFRNETLGMIGVANRPTTYEEDHEQLLTTYAVLIATVIRNAQLYEQLSDANAQLTRRIAEQNQVLARIQQALTRRATQIQGLLLETVDVLAEERVQRKSADFDDDDIRILQQLTAGANNATIAAHQNVSETTLKRRLRVIFRKLNAENRTQAVAAAVRQGLI